MKIVTLSNFFNHHQKTLADALYKLTNGNFWFVETEEMRYEQRKLGYHTYNVPYTIHYANHQQEVEELILNADIVLYGQAPLSMIKKRIRNGGIVFKTTERRYKSKKRYLKWPIYTYQSMTLNKTYLLCCGAYTARDFIISGMSANRCFKWAYFTEVKEFSNLDTIIDAKLGNNLKNGKFSILWASRMIGWKHPEMAVKLACKLREDGINFKISMIGCGPCECKIKEIIRKKQLQNYVELLGSMSPEDVRIHMEKSDIFLATSDQNEGWGATVNEAMSSACVVVGSHAIGSVPFLINDGVNGLVFRSKDVYSLYEKVKYLIEHPTERREMSKKAYITIKEKWCAEIAAKNIIILANAIKNGSCVSIKDGPCSMAPVMEP